MEVNETSAARVNDVYSELAKITAADTEQIGIAMSKVASLAHSANMEFETTAAFLTQIIETTQEAPGILCFSQNRLLKATFEFDFLIDLWYTHNRGD